MTVHVVVRSIAPYGRPGGLENAARLHVDAMRASGLPVDVYTAAEGPDVISVGWPHIPLPGNAVRFTVGYVIWSARVTLLLRERLNVDDILHLHGAASFVAVLLRASGRRRAPAVANPHGMEEFRARTPRDRCVTAPLRWMGRRGARASAVVISTDSTLTKAVVSNLKVSPSKVTLIPNSIRTEDFSVLTGKDWTTWRIVSMGRLEWNKGYDILRDALVDIAARHPEQEVRWDHIGNGSEFAAVFDVVDRPAGDNLTVRCHRSLDDAAARRLLAQATIFVQPSRYEGSSLTTLEAMASGVCVVATPVGGIPDKIDDGVTGILAASADAGHLSASIERAMTCDVQAIGRRAALHVRENFDVGVATRRYLAVYSGLL